MSAHRFSTASVAARSCITSDRVVQHVIARLTAPVVRKPRPKKTVSLPKVTIQTR